MNPDNSRPVIAPLDRSSPVRFELVYHSGLLLISVSVLIMSFLMKSAGEYLVYLPGSHIPLSPSCASQQIFGIDCPGCGLTRSFIAISQGQWVRAWHFNPASFLVYLFVAGQIPWRLFQLWRMSTKRDPIFSMWLFVPLGAAIAGLLLQWIVKLAAKA